MARTKTQRLLWLTLLLALFGPAPPGRAGERCEDVITWPERQALLWRDSAEMTCPETLPRTPAGLVLASVAPPPARVAGEISSSSPGWLTHGGWYAAALLALSGMLVSSLLAQRISRERDAARQASRVKSDFLANVSHEIRTPMNAILGFTQILKEQLEDEKQRQYVNAISASGNTLLRLINDLLDLAKIEAGKFELQPTAVALKSVALEIQNIFLQVVADKRIDFVLELDPALPEAVLIDEVRLRQILFNLLKNAVKFTERGKVSLSLRVRSISANHLLELAIVVSDTGIGIPEEEQAAIFDAFTQRKSQDQAKYAGTGLGLSIAKRLVEMIGGELTLSSEVGQGSTFTALLREIPVVSASALHPDAQEMGKCAIRFDQEAVVLIIDAIDSNRMVFREFLRPSTLSVVETVSVEAGIDWCMAIKPDLIILDYTMSYLRDSALVQRFNRVKEELNIAVVAVTAGDAGVGSADFHTDFLFDAWLHKPVLFEDFCEVLARFLPHSTYSRKRDTFEPGDIEMLYVLPEAAEVARTVAALGERVPVLRRILFDNMLVQYDEISETFIISEIKNFAQEAGRLAMEFDLDFLGLWAAELLRQAKSFDMERLPATFGLFPQLLSLIAGDEARLGPGNFHENLPIGNI